MSQKRQCPVCWTFLSEERYAKAIGIWGAQRAHLEHLKKEARRLKQAQAELKREKAAIVRQYRVDLLHQLNRQRSQLQKSFRRSVQKQVGQALRKEKAELAKSQ